MCNDAGLRDGGGDVADTAHDRRVTEDPPQHIVFLNAVLKRDNCGAARNQRSDCARRALGVPELYADEDEIDWSQRGGIVRDAWRLDVEIAELARDPQAILLERREMSAARDERDLGSTLGKAAAEVTAQSRLPP